MCVIITNIMVAAGISGRGRFKSFPVQRDEHLITVLRYVLQNPGRPGCRAQRESGHGRVCEGHSWPIRVPWMTSGTPVVFSLIEVIGLYGENKRSNLWHRVHGRLPL